MSAFTDLSDALSKAVETSGAGIVRVNARPRFPASGIIWSADGIILTAHHVVEEDEGISVGMADGRNVAAKLVGRDPTTDIAVLRAEATALSNVKWADASRYRVGSLVLGLGRPGKTVRATLGVISAVGDVWRTPAGGRIDRYLESDITMYPGFSGGPLVDASGDLIGMNTSALLRDASVSIPFSTLQQVVQTLLTKGKISRGYLGVGLQPVRLPENLQKQLQQETGLLIVSVEPGGPADKAGLLQGDVIASVAGEQIRHLDDLLGALSSDRVGTSVPVRFIRGGQIQDTNAVVGERE